MPASRSLQRLADGDQDVGLRDQLALPSAAAAGLVEPGPLAEVVDAVVDPALDRQAADQVGDDRQGRDGDRRARACAATTGVKLRSKQLAVEPAVEARSRTTATSSRLSTRKFSRQRRSDAGACVGLPSHCRSFSSAAPQRGQVEPGRRSADGVDPAHRDAGRAGRHQVLAARRVPAPVVGEHQQDPAGSWRQPSQHLLVELRGSARASAPRRTWLGPLAARPGPCRRRRSASPASRRIAAASAASSPEGASKPVSPCTTTSATPPTRVETTGSAGRHRLDHRQRDALADAGEQEQVGRRQQPRDVGPQAEQAHVRPPACGSAHLGLDLGPLRALADEDQPGARAARARRARACGRPWRGP